MIREQTIICMVFVNLQVKRRLTGDRDPVLRLSTHLLGLGLFISIYAHTWRTYGEAKPCPSTRENLTFGSVSLLLSSSYIGVHCEINVDVKWPPEWSLVAGPCFDMCLVTLFSAATFLPQC